MDSERIGGTMAKGMAPREEDDMSEHMMFGRKGKRGKKRGGKRKGRRRGSRSY